MRPASLTGSTSSPRRSGRAACGAGRRPASARRLRRWLLPGALAAGWTLATFLPILAGDFVNWDDLQLLVDNRDHRGPWDARLRGAWTTSRLGEYMPLTWMSYGLDHALFDLDARGYHLTSLLLHVATALAVLALAWRLLRLALGPDPAGSVALAGGATVAALAFALHPLRVEAVAWVSARGTVLGGLLLVLAVLAYLAGWERRAPGEGLPGRWMALSLGCFAASLLARSTGLVLPAVLLVLDVYPLRRLGGGPGRWLGPSVRRVWIEKLGFAGLAVLAVPVAFRARVGAERAFADFGHDPLIALAWGLHSGAWYVWKTLLPAGLGPVYWMPSREDPGLGLVALAGLAVAGLTVGLVALRRRWPGALAAWAAYAILLGPLSGLVPFGRLRGVADRYTYVACIGWAVVAGGAWVLRWRAAAAGPASGRRRAWLAVPVALLLLGWSVASWHQTHVWRNGLSLWRWALMVTPGSPVVHNNLGWALAYAGQLEEAEAHVRAAGHAWPDHLAVLHNLGRILARQGRLEEAARVLERAVAVTPRSAETRTDLDSVAESGAQPDGAGAELERAVRLDPDGWRRHGAGLAGAGRRP